MDSDWRIRYGRHIGLSEIGETGQQRVSQSAALLVGLGGWVCRSRVISPAQASAPCI